MSSTGRADFDGIDNAALDFSQLEDYINDEEDNQNTIYFQEALVNSDLRPEETPQTAFKVTAVGQQQQPTTGQLQPTPPHPGAQPPPAPPQSAGLLPQHYLGVGGPVPSGPTPAPRSTTTVTLAVNNSNKSPKSQSSRTSHQTTTIVQQTPGAHHPQQLPSHLTGQTVTVHPQPQLPPTTSVTVTHIGYNGHQSARHNGSQQPPVPPSVSVQQPLRHHLPDSPPDSGSEPPFSPLNDDKVISSVNSVASQPNNTTSDITMLEPTIEGMKQFMSYTTAHTPLKQLLPQNEISLTITPPHHSPQQQAMTGLPPMHSHPVVLIPQEVPPINQMVPIPGPLGLQATPVTTGMVSPATAGHLTTLYATNEEYMAACISSPEQQQQHHSSQQSNGQTSKKRKLSGKQSTNNTSMMNGGVVHIKQEPDGLSPEPNNNLHTTTSMIIPGDDEYFDYGPDGQIYLDSVYQCIRFQIFQNSPFSILCDSSLKELPTPNYKVEADKGFNFSNADDAFVCQKKNHFQVTVHIQPIGLPACVKSTDGIKKIDNFYLHFYGVKVESPAQTIKVEQSQSDRSKKAFHPVLVNLCPDQVTKTTVGRLHFSETTSNNMRKKGKPNPDQRYFYLVVALHAHVADQSYPIIAHSSERIIVRASNPGQFENDIELSWQKGHSPESIYHAGRVGINTDRPDESLVVYGNVKVTGHIIQPSDKRAKQNIEELDTKEQLKNVQNMRIVRYQFKPEFAKEVGLEGDNILGTGVLAQEVQKILPDAVKETGDVVLPDGETIENFLVVNKDRIFMENVGAVKELCKVTDNLETRIDELERMNNKLNKFNRFDSIKSVISMSSVASGSTVTSNSIYNNSNNTRPTCYKHYKHRHRNSVSAPTICTNKFIQTVIMVLVLIMAFCLASIATLYVLEYHRRHSHHSQPLQDTPSIQQQQQHTYNTNTHQSSPVNIVYTPYPHQSQQPPQQQYPSSSVITYHDPQSIHQSTDKRHNPNRDKTQMSVYSFTTSSSVRTRPTSIPILKPQVLGIPYSCLDVSTVIPSCPIHCCSDNTNSNSNNNNNNDRSYAQRSSTFSTQSSSPSSPSARTSSTQVVTKSTYYSTNNNNNNNLMTQMTANGLSNNNNKNGDSKTTNTLGHEVVVDVDPYSKTSYIDETASGDLNHPNTLNRELDNSEPPTNIYNTTFFTRLYDRLLNNSGRNSDTIDTKKRTDETFALKYGSVDLQNTQNEYPKSGEEVSRERRETSEANQKESAFNSMPQKDLSKSVDSIKLIELNATIGREYCNTLQCIQGSGPKFNYLIPLSKYMELEYVTLQFSLNQHMKVDHCESKTKPASCVTAHDGADDVPQSYHRSTDHILVPETTPNWRIPIGIYMRSTFVFRILARDSVADSPCNLADSQSGISFVEYKLEFYRKCDK
ncbi:uncharacterized protein LOC128962921 isoform X2 [Oppia nitens]|uniref:uncharacterized protein LOC128962921 isoform X2 n=1 Tax=Oppia nitens TaxID=1686743 RepID=UPI0023D9FAFF|nr:uncharacterized protein LOC128962921 isoform X2 [Oppia nitens]